MSTASIEVLTATGIRPLLKNEGNQYYSYVYGLHLDSTVTAFEILREFCEMDYTVHEPLREMILKCGFDKMLDAWEAGSKRDDLYVHFLSLIHI